MRHLVLVSLLLLGAANAAAEEVAVHKAQLLEPVAGRKSKAVKGVLALDRLNRNLTFKANTREPLAIPYSSIETVRYERALSRPPVIPSLIFWPVAFWPERRHYLTIHYKGATGDGQYAILQLYDDTFREVVAAVESHLGKPVEWKTE